MNSCSSHLKVNGTGGNCLRPLVSIEIRYMVDGGYEILQIRETHCGAGENMCNVHFFT